MKKQQIKIKDKKKSNIHANLPYKKPNHTSYKKIERTTKKSTNNKLEKKIKKKKKKKKKIEKEDETRRIFLQINHLRIVFLAIIIVFCRHEAYFSRKESNRRVIIARFLIPTIKGKKG